ncbi:MAG: glutamate racemase [Clostridia bacterium]|nr:glutamate racemase [Clostridia bacterium]
MIGVFDSGLGGLTALKELRELMPNEDVVYFGDTARVPYGPRTPETIVSYAKQDVRFLSEFKPRAILAACGTVSSTAMDALGECFTTPIIGVVDATAQAAAEATKNGKIGIIGTAATIASRSYEKALSKLGDYTLTATPCPLFVPLVENGFTAPDCEITRLTVEHYLREIKAAGCDTLILGCTHYPIIAHHIAKALPGVTLINSGKSSAQAMKALCEGIPEGENTASVSYYVSDDKDGFIRQAELFLGHAADGEVRQIDITRY